MELDNYASHLHIFEKVFATFEIKKVLEFGLGKFSTPFFANHAELVVSVEQESKEWYERIKAQINSANWHPVFQADPQIVFEQFDAKNENFDLVFSDGAAKTRCLAANLAMERNVPVVVCTIPRWFGIINGICSVFLLTMPVSIFAIKKV